MIDNQKTGHRNWDKKAHLFSAPYYKNKLNAKKRLPLDSQRPSLLIIQMLCPQGMLNLSDRSFRSEKKYNS